VLLTAPTEILVTFGQTTGIKFYWFFFTSYSMPCCCTIHGDRIVTIDFCDVLHMTSKGATRKYIWTALHVVCIHWKLLTLSVHWFCIYSMNFLKRLQKCTQTTNWDNISSDSAWSIGTSAIAIVEHGSFNRIRQMAPICTLLYGSLGQRKSAPQTAFRSVQPFLQDTRSWPTD